MVKNLSANAGDARDGDSTPGLGRSLGVGNGNPIQYSCLGNSMDRGAWWATVHGGHKKLDMTEHAHTYTHTHTHTQSHIVHHWLGSHFIGGNHTPSSLVVNFLLENFE